MFDMGDPVGVKVIVASIVFIFLVVATGILAVEYYRKKRS